MLQHLIRAFSFSLAGLALTACNTTQKTQTVNPNNRICFEAEAPNPNWIAGIQEVRVDEMDLLHVYAEAKMLRQDGMTPMVIANIGDCVRVARNGREIVSYLAGANWNWESPGVTKVSGIKEYRGKLKGLKTKVIFPKD